MLFYVRRHTGADGSFEWYVLNGHTRRRASNFFPTRAAAAAEREKLQARLDLAKAKVFRRAPKGARKNNAPAAGAESCGASYGEGRLAGQEPQRRGADQSSPRGTDKPAASLHSPATEKAPPRGGASQRGR
jgi:hypothetical protein